MIAPRRLRRMTEVLDARLHWVRCAVEHVHHRHNTSAILRTCDALGVHRVHLIGTPALRVSNATARGAQRWLDLHPHDTVEDAIAALRDAGVALYVADLDDDAIAPQDLPLDRPICLWFGAELVGVSAAARAAADGVVTIPMHGMAQSLNVSVATAIALETVAERARREVPAPGLPADEVRATLDAWISREVADADTARDLARALRDLDPTPR